MRHLMREKGAGTETDKERDREREREENHIVNMSKRLKIMWKSAI